MNKKLSELSKVFEDFERDIETLESLESELKHLDTYGFEEEVKKIKVLLKDTSKILSIRLKLRELKRKIEKPEIKKEDHREKKGKGGGKVLTRFVEMVKRVSESIKEKQRQKKLGRRKKSEKQKEAEQKFEELKEEKPLTKEKIDMIEERVEESFDKHTDLKIFNKPDKEIKQKPKSQTNHRNDKPKEKILSKMPTVSELVQRTKERFVKNKTGIDQDNKNNLIKQLKEQYISRQESGFKSESSVEKFNHDFFRMKSESKPKLKLKQSFSDVLEQGNNIRKPLLEPKIEKGISKSPRSKEDIIGSLKEYFNTN